MKIKTKIIWGYALISMLILLVTIVSLYSINQIREYRDSVDQMNETVIVLREVQYYFTGQANDERGFLLTGKPEFRAEIEEKANHVKQKINILKPRMQLSKEKELLTRIDEAHTAFTNINIQVLDLYNMGKVDEAVQLSFNEGRKVRKELTSSFNELIDIQLEENAESKSGEESLSSKIMAMILSTSVLTVLMGIIFGLIIARNIVNPINTIAHT